MSTQKKDKFYLVHGVSRLEDNSYCRLTRRNCEIIKVLVGSEVILYVLIDVMHRGFES
jgi:hypothetical protein